MNEPRTRAVALLREALNNVDVFAESLLEMIVASYEVEIAELEWRRAREFREVRAQFNSNAVADDIREAAGLERLRDAVQSSATRLEPGPVAAVPDMDDWQEPLSPEARVGLQEKQTVTIVSADRPLDQHSHPSHFPGGINPFTGDVHQFEKDEPCPGCNQIVAEPCEKCREGLKVADLTPLDGGRERKIAAIEAVYGSSGTDGTTEAESAHGRRATTGPFVVVQEAKTWLTEPVTEGGQVVSSPVAPKRGKQKGAAAIDPLIDVDTAVAVVRCGGTGMLPEAIASVVGIGLPEAQILYERYGKQIEALQGLATRLHAGYLEVFRTEMEGRK